MLKCEYMETFRFKQGEFILVAGTSGSGKTTLLNGLKDRLGLSAGMVTQNVDEGIVTDKVWHELAFGLESLGYDTPTIRSRVAEMASFFGIQNWFYKNVGIEEKNLEECCQEMYDFYVYNSTHNLQAIRKKFSHSKFDEVAKIKLC